MALTGNVKDFLVRYMRSDVPAEHRAAYRDCKCEGHAASDKAVAGRIAALLDREDVKGYLQQQEARRDILRTLAQRKVDNALADVVLSATEARQIALEALTEAVMNERDALRADTAKSLQGLSRTADSIERLTRYGTGDDGGLTEEEARHEFAEAQQAQQATQPPAPKEGNVPIMVADPNKPIGSA